MTDIGIKAYSLAEQCWRLSRRWGRLGGLAALDQFLFSGSNFAVNILLARWTSPAVYGAFAVAFSLYLFLAGLLCSLTLEPMMIFGANDYRNRLRAYLSKIGWLHAVVASLIGLPLFGIALAGEGDAGGLFRWAAIALPFMLASWFVRRAFYTRGAIGHAMLGNLVYALLLLGGLVVIQRASCLSGVTIYAVFICASVGNLIYYLMVCRVFPDPPSLISINQRELLLRHWNYGKWMMAATLASSVSTLMYAPVLALVASLEAAAAYKAIQNMTLPLTQVLASFSLLLLPLLSRRLGSRDHDDSRVWLYLGFLAYVVSALGYGMLMMVLGAPVIRNLYANDFYTEYVWMIPFFVVVLTTTSACQFLGLVVRAWEAPRVILLAKAVGAGGVVLGLVSVPIFRLKGVLFCMMASALLELCVMLIYCGRRRS